MKATRIIAYMFMIPFVIFMVLITFAPDVIALLGKLTIPIYLFGLHPITLDLRFVAAMVPMILCSIGMLLVYNMRDEKKTVNILDAPR